MDSYSEAQGYADATDEVAPEHDVPAAIGTDERRMHVRAYNYWASLLNGRDFPSLEDLQADKIEEFGPHSVILDFTGKASLLADVPWLQQSVDRRSPYIDVLNHVQIELLRRRRAGDNDAPLANRCLRLSIQAIAAGLRTTG